MTKHNVSFPLEVYFFGIALLTSLGLMPILFFYLQAKKIETAFWKDIATQYGYTYVFRPYFQDSALVFQEGSHKTTGHGLMGTVYDCAFRLFQYRYETTVAGIRQSAVRAYVVSEVVFSGTFPHMYLNNTHNFDLSNLKSFFLPKISLPTDLEEKFDLHGPKEYEIEVLEIFTPDILAHLLDAGWEHDIELVDQKLYVYSEKPLRSKLELEYEVERLQKLVSLLAPKLNRLTLTPIGNLKSTL